MAAQFDVAARLAEGRTAVGHTQIYVGACHVLGYQHPELTAHSSQVCDWYDAEVGLDLGVLDDDSAELVAAVDSVEEALHAQRAQLAELAAAWRGSGADSAAQFLQRHCDAATAVVAHVRGAAEGCAALRDNLWEMVDGKVATAIAIDDRRPGERSAWLAAAHTVTTGAGDRSAAEELVRQQVNPYVDNDIRIDWLTVMRSTAEAVGASYDVTIHALTSVPEVYFEIPGELGPSWRPVADDPLGPSSATRDMPEVTSPTEAVATMPAAVTAPLPPTPVAPPMLPVGGLEDLSTMPTGLADQPDDGTGRSTGASNLGGLAENIGGVVGKIVDGIGGLLGSLAEGFADPSGAGDPQPDAALDAHEPLADEADDARALSACEDAIAPSGADKDATCETPNASVPVADEGDEEVQPITPSPVDTPPPASPPPGEPPPVEPPPAEAPPVRPSPDDSSEPSEPPPEAATPCEIAADELPQAGR